MKKWLLSLIGYILGIFVHLFDALFCVVLIAVHFTPFWFVANKKVGEFNTKHIKNIARKL